MDAVAVAQTLAGILGALIVAAVGYWLGGRGKQTVTACEKCRVDCDAERAKAMEELRQTVRENKDRQSRDIELVMRMLRSLVLYSNIPEAEKERILNDRSGK